MRMLRSVAPLTAVALTFVSGNAMAQSPSPSPTPSASPSPAPPRFESPPVQVIGTTPLPGTGIDRDKVPANVQTLSSADISLEGTPSLITALTDKGGSVNMNAVLDDSFQPDILFRGFAASPVLGTPQGLAVYQNGVRINEPFGDTVNWDLIPDIAIDRLDIVSANPVYGLNALGGAMMVTMKNGFTNQGFTAEVAGGSFGQRGGIVEYGQQFGSWSGYVAGRIFDSDGWRQFSSDKVRQLYADIGTRGSRGFMNINFTGASNTLLGEGTTPVQELAVDRSLVFTSPQNNTNKLEFVTINGLYQATDTLALQGNAYGRNFTQTVANGNTTDYASCNTGNLLCQSDGVTPLVTPSGGSIPDISEGGTIPIGENDFETIHGFGVGGTLQATATGKLFGQDNHFVLGASVDHANVDFSTSAEVGVINPALQVLPSSYFVATPENTPFDTVPLSVRSTTTYYGVFLTDTLNLTRTLTVTASGRYNSAQIDLVDHLGTSLSGSSHYTRFNPAIGATYTFNPKLTVYAGYAAGNRAPTASEIECSNPTSPCLLPTSLSSDPPNLKQVVSHTYEAGLRGSKRTNGSGRFAWSLGVFRTDLTDDLYGVAVTLSTAFFENIASTRRQGIEANFSYHNDKWSLFVSYALVDATFQSPLLLPSASNPLADENGNISVQPGDKLPGIPEHQFKAGASYHATSKWTVGAVLVGYSSQYYRGDEANLNPRLPGYVIVNLHSTYAFTKHIDAFLNVQNLFDTKYETFAQYGDPTGIGAPGIPADAVTNGPGVDNRFLAPAPPIAVFGGVHVRF